MNLVKGATAAAGVGMIGAWGANVFVRRRRTREQIYIAIVILALIAAAVVGSRK